MKQQYQKQIQQQYATMNCNEQLQNNTTDLTIVAKQEKNIN